MKYALPNDHGLSDQLCQSAALLPRSSSGPSLTDVQYEALANGISLGNSALISAPTSTGKTLIGWWAIASALKKGKKAVYLVSHRALAKQKFDEARSLFLDDWLDGDQSSLVCATGDGVEDSFGRKNSSPLAATLLIATYEKFLSCMSVGGPVRDMTDTCFICDEVQLLGDKQRGQNAELLLTLLKRAGWYQFVGLSAVLAPKDASAIADWLQVQLIRNPSREKTLVIQCIAPNGGFKISSGAGFEGEFEALRSPVTNSNLNSLINHLVTDPTRRPVIVFCMKVDATYECSTQWAATRTASTEVVLQRGQDIEPQLVDALRRGTAYHNAELTEDERVLVEQRLRDGLVDVVFATSTLAAGVNFPFGSAIFQSWTRWNFDRKEHEPIGRADFQNMAGRVGRMGQEASEGLALMTATTLREVSQARALADMQRHENLGAGIDPDDFGTLALQLFAGKLCRTRNDAFALIASTLTASRELESNQSGIDHWKPKLFAQIDRLIVTGCLIESAGELAVTTFGYAVAQSGLKPETALFFLDGFIKRSTELTALASPTNNTLNENDFVFVLAHAALLSPEFKRVGGKATRSIGWRVGQNGSVSNSYARRLQELLLDKEWTADASAANGALLLADWASGQPRDQIEKVVNGVRLGTVQSLGRDVAWILTGIAGIVARVTHPTIAIESRPLVARGDAKHIEALRQIARTIRRQAGRINAGLPSDVYWMTSLNLKGLRPRLTRGQMLSLRNAGLVRPIDLMDGGAEADVRRIEALESQGDKSLANLVRDAARTWRLNAWAHARAFHLKRASRLGSAPFVAELYDSKGNHLEDAFQHALEELSIDCKKLDHAGRQGWPDFWVRIENFAPIIVEIKSKQNANETISLNGATEVLAASELAGYKDAFCLTVCSPGVDPSVPATIEACKRLGVVDVSDLVEAFLRLSEGTLTRAELYNWLTTPGIALAEELAVAS